MKIRAWDSGHSRKPLPVIKPVAICHRSSFSGVISPTRPARRAASFFILARAIGESSVALNEGDSREPKREVRMDWRVSTLGMLRNRLDQSAA